MRLGYRPALDGVRAMAIILVLVLHGGYLHGGFLGVDLFFVLSGFLITALLLREWTERRSISLARFYVRRARRLLPALGLLIAGVGVIYVVLPNVQRGIGYWASAAAVAGYAGNWVAAAPPASLAKLGLFAHTWSLAIEEQFYIVWPPVLLLLLRRRVRLDRIAAWLVAAAVGSATLRYLTAHSPATDARTITRADGLLLGCATLLLIARAGGANLRRLMARPSVGATAVGVLAVLVAILGQDGVSTYDGGLFLFNLAASALVAHVVLAPSAPLARILSLRPLAWIGARSYGIYLYHYPIFFAVAPASLGLTRLAFFAVASTLTIVCAAASYRFVERPLLERTQYPRIAEVSRPALGSPAASSPAPSR